LGLRRLRAIAARRDHDHRERRKDALEAVHVLPSFLVRAWLSCALFGWVAWLYNASQRGIISNFCGHVKVLSAALIRP
jgi:hypothetical protein